MKIVIVGGVAGGASAAARARRLMEDAEIVMFERGAEPSFANCGMPYYIGGEIENRQKLLVAPQKMLRERHRIDVRTRTNVESIDRRAKTVTVRDLESGQTSTQSYDKLILCPGAAPFRPPVEGIDSPRIYTLRDLSDADMLHTAATSEAESAVVVGGGFIGVEMAENLVRRGLKVTIVELAGQILPPWDREMTSSLSIHLQSKGVKLLLGESAAAFEDRAGEVDVKLKSGQTFSANFLVLCIGVRPENSLAIEAGLACGERGGIITNSSMQTSDADIYAAGDVVEVREFVSGAAVQIPLAGPANRQGRIAADHIAGRESTFRGVQGTAVVSVFDMTAAMTGLSEKMLSRMKIPFEKTYIHPANHAGYFPGAEPMTLKLLFASDSGKILGAQAVGGGGVDKRIDVIAMAIQAGMTVFDLEEAELCYAPQYGSAKDAVNMAGFVAAGILRGDQPVVHAPQIEDTTSFSILDVRSDGEFASGHIPGAIHIPIEQLRERLQEVPAGKPVIAYCKVGMRGYLATRVLLQHGMKAKNLSGGITTWRQFFPDRIEQ